MKILNYRHLAARLLLAVAVVTNMSSVSMLMGIDMRVVCIHQYSECGDGR